MPKFNNRENKRIELPSGDLFFHARSTAVVACVICMVGDVPHVLMVERGEKVDNSGLWCLPCGYLDWDESLGEAVVRELFEETGLDIGEIPQERIIHRDENVPYYIESSPKAHRQNISHHFGIALRGPLPALNAKAAIESGRRYWMSPVIGYDINDHYLQYGVFKTAQEIRKLIYTKSLS